VTATPGISTLTSTSVRTINAWKINAFKRGKNFKLFSHCKAKRKLPKKGKTDTRIWFRMKDGMQI
jgi:hypothetical protein